MHIPFVTEVQKGHITGWKSDHNLLKNAFLKLNIQDEGHLFSNCLFYILTIFRNFLFQLSGCGIHTFADSHPNRGWKWTYNLLTEMVLFWTKCSFWCLFSEMKVTCMPIASFILRIFTLNAFLFSSLIEAYIYTFPS